jgi:hypothetical protein
MLPSVLMNLDFAAGTAAGAATFSVGIEPRGYSHRRKRPYMGFGMFRKLIWTFSFS